TLLGPLLVGFTRTSSRVNRKSSAKIVARAAGRRESSHDGVPPSGKPRTVHHFPVLGIDVHGFFGGSGAPFCNSSIECLSGERTKAIVPSRGGRLMVTPAFISFSHSV